MLDECLRTKREKIVLDHLEAELQKDWDGALSAFPHPRYEIVPVGAAFDGEAAVRAYYHVTETAFPDRRHEVIELRHSDDAVIVEFFLLGTHLGPHGAIPPTGQPFKVRMTAFFIFDEDQILTERVYFDALSMLKQLLRGKSLRKPWHWPLLMRVMRGVVQQFN